MEPNYIEKIKTIISDLEDRVSGSERLIENLRINNVYYKHQLNAIKSDLLLHLDQLIEESDLEFLPYNDWVIAKLSEKFKDLMITGDGAFNISGAPLVKGDYDSIEAFFKDASMRYTGEVKNILKISGLTKTADGCFNYSFIYNANGIPEKLLSSALRPHVQL